MYLENPNKDTIVATVTQHDLARLGFTPEEFAQNSNHVDSLIRGIMEKAYEDFDFKGYEALAIKIEARRDEDMIVTVMKVKDIESLSGSMVEGGSFDSPDYISGMAFDELESPFDYGGDEVSDEPDLVSLVYRFTDIEVIIQLAHRLKNNIPLETRLVSYKNRYYLILDNINLNDEFSFYNIDAILLEYGDETPVREAVLMEYGNVICKEQALEQIVKYF